MDPITASCTYKGYDIRPIPRWLPHRNRWGLELIVTKPASGTEPAKEVTVRADSTFKTERGAKRHAILLGKLMIDGKVPGTGVDRL
jgi:hypothetical protein